MNDHLATINVGIDTIDLWRQNPRYSHLNFKTQDEIINHLCENEQIYEIAKDIRQRGLNLLENFGLFPLEQNDIGETITSAKYEVREGKRRLCALKLLKDPSRAPSRLQKNSKNYLHNRPH